MTLSLEPSYIQALNDGLTVPGLPSSAEDPQAAASVGVGLSATSLNAGLLTPDALLTYCQARLDSIDGQVNASFTQQQLRNNENVAIQQVLQTFQNSANGTNDTAAITKMETDLHSLIEQIKATDPGCPVLPKLMQTYNDLLETGTSAPGLLYEEPSQYAAAVTGNPGDNDVSSTEMQTFIGNLKDAAADLNSGAELQMIQLQSLMAQRQTAIQLTTNLVQSLGDQAQKIAENVGR